MVEISFFHLKTRSVEDALPTLLEISLSRGWRVVVQTATAARLRALPKDAQSEALLRFWTAKEAYLKALGTGFSREPATIAVDLDFRVREEGAEVALTAGEWRTVELGGRKFLVASAVLIRRIWRS